MLKKHVHYNCKEVDHRFQKLTEFNVTEEMLYDANDAHNLTDGSLP